MRKEFIEAVVNEIKSIVGDNAKVMHQEVQKNNGLVLNGITILMKGESVAPTIYLENYVDGYTRELYGDKIRDIAKDIIMTSAKAREEYHIDTSKITEPEYVRENVTLQLINYKANEEMLKELVYKRFLDLAIIFRVELGNFASYKVTNQILDMLDISKEELFRIAKENTPRLYPVVGQNLEEKIFYKYDGKGLSPFKHSEPVSLYFLSNEQENFGASTILYDGVLETIADQAEANLIIIPSSVHECLIMPQEALMNVEEITEMVRTVNGDVISPEEILSDYAYIYDRETKEISIPN